MKKKLIVNGVEVYKHRNYSAYRAADCRATGLPMYTGADRPRNLLSTTQRQRSRHPVREDELPTAWFRVMNGYVPLYEKVEGDRE